MKEHVRNKLYDYSSISPWAAANAIHGFFATKYAGRAFTGLTSNQLHSLVNNLRNNEATGDNKYRIPPMSICGADDSRPWLQFDVWVNVVSAAGRRKTELTHMIGWAHLGTLLACL